MTRKSRWWPLSLWWYVPILWGMTALTIVAAVGMAIFG